MLPDPPLVDEATGIGLRAWGRAGDAEALVAAWIDREVARWTAVPVDRSAAAAQAWIGGEAQRRAEGSTIDLAVADLRNHDSVLGEVGLVVIDEEQRWAEAGWWLTPSARGRGIASAALDLLVTWASAKFDLALLCARTDPFNPRAGCVAERARFVLAGTSADGSQVWRR